MNKNVKKEEVKKPAAEVATYRVHHGFNHNDRDYRSGEEIELTVEDAGRYAGQIEVIR